jgi:hypothetical protein
MTDHNIYNQEIDEAIDASKREIYEDVVSSKILALMKKLRNEDKDENKRRWIWELLQNAKDVYNEKNRGVDVIVNLDQNNYSLAFSPPILE